MVGYDGSGIYKVWDGTKVIKTKDVVFDEKQVWRGRPANSPPHLSFVSATKTPQIPEIIVLEVELQEVHEALENDGGDNIDHSHMPPTLLEIESSSPSNLDTESMSPEFQTRQRLKLPTGFQYTAWLTTAFLLGHEVGVKDPSTYHEAMIGANAKEWKLGCDNEFYCLDVNNT